MARSSNTLLEVLIWFVKSGRRGGVGLLVLSTPFLFASYALGSQALVRGDTETVFYSPAAMFFGGFFFVAGVVVIITGGLRAKRRFEPLPDAQLQARVATDALPFCVCLDCRVVMPYEVAVGRCPDCESAGSCLEVLDESDRRTANAAVA